MQLGFVSAILADQSLEELLAFSSAAKFDCVELLCWPPGKAERRYAGVTHVDVVDFSKDDAKRVLDQVGQAGITISSLGYYPNPLVPDRNEAQVYVDHIKKVIVASEMLGVNLVTTFIGRDHTKSIDENWPRFVEIFKPLLQFAEDHGVRVGIENCPMLFTQDEWPGGKNLAYSPAIWRRMFEDVPSKNFGLNYDPSHLCWLQIDYLAPMREFASRIFHVHAKDVRVDKHRLNDVGVMGTPLQFHSPKLPGLGDVDWTHFFSVLTDTGYDGPVCIEVEDRAYEASLDTRKAALVQSARFLRNFIPVQVQV